MLVPDIFLKSAFHAGCDKAGGNIAPISRIFCHPLFDLWPTEPKEISDVSLSTLSMPTDDALWRWTPVGFASFPNLHDFVHTCMHRV